MDACTFLAERAPELTIDQLATVLGVRAAALESLWDAWGQVRPVLLRERGDLDGEPA